MNPISDGLPSRADWTQHADIVFLVGCPRSGTTWLQAMLASHPLICTGPETHFFATLARSEGSFLNNTLPRVGLAYYLNEESYYTAIKNLFWSLVSMLPAPALPAKYFLEKTPEHALNGSFILHTFPNARFIHLIRDARAVVASLLRASTGWGKEWAPKTALESVLMWRKYVKAGQAIAQLVTRADQYTEIKYEAFRQKPQENLQRLFSWLAVPYDPELVQSAVEVNSLEDVRASSAVFQSIADRAKSAEYPAQPAYPEGFLGSSPFRVEDIKMSYLQRLRVEHDAGELLRKLGYPNVRKRLAPWERVLISMKVRKMLGLSQI